MLGNVTPAICPHHDPDPPPAPHPRPRSQGVTAEERMVGERPGLDHHQDLHHGLASPKPEGGAAMLSVVSPAIRPRHG